MGSSRRCARIISSIACFTYFLVIFLQIPLFRVPCRVGMCKTPLELTCSHIIASKLIPENIVNSLLYPGAIANSLYSNHPLPNFHHFLHSYHHSANRNLPHDDLHRLEVLAGSYLSVGGSLVGLMKPGRMSLFGTLLALWGLSREVMISRKSLYISSYQDHDHDFDQEAVYIYPPAMSIALISAFLSVRKDIRKIHRSFKGRPALKHKLV